MFQTPVLRPHPQRDRHRDDGGRQHLRARPRQLDPDGGARRSCAAWPARIWPTPTGRCTPRRSSATPARPGPCPIWPGATSCIAWRSAPTQRRSGCDGALDGPLAGKHALITGGGTGIGAAIALKLAGAGAAVSLVGRRAEPLEEVAARLPRAKAIVADVTTRSRHERHGCGRASRARAHRHSHRQCRGRGKCADCEGRPRPLAAHARRQPDRARS